jgi:hypothetical protein
MDLHAEVLFLGSCHISVFMFLKLTVCTSCLGMCTGSELVRPSAHVIIMWQISLQIQS